MYKPIFSLSLLVSSALVAADLGTQGENVPILEYSMTEMIQEGLKHLTPEEKAKIQEQMIAQVKNPTPVDGIQEATEYRSRSFDPSIEVAADIKDTKGTIIASKGTRINPLDQLSVKDRPLLFLDGTNPKHIAWAKTQGSQAKWILVKGSPLELVSLERQIFFDQGGFLTKHFHLTRIPCRIREQEDKLLIEEIPVSQQ